MQNPEAAQRALHRARELAGERPVSDLARQPGEETMRRNAAIR